MLVAPPAASSLVTPMLARRHRQSLLSYRSMALSMPHVALLLVGRRPGEDGGIEGERRKNSGPRTCGVHVNPMLTQPG
uniref:Uncharacterized protein n=1 Tax=Oryza sativa subsp. japonica TaxID=39947 RepID=Q6H629_ORYSJ|nr:hypothetical protein [Oryza sativa Japonica Group]BAD25820.1 hypothetical protein [Oryza sativa Japonica Group]